MSLGVVIEFYTDGAYSSARKAGGIGIVIVKNGVKVYEHSKTYYDTTNNKCELLAVITALHSISKPVDQIIIHSDSQYVIGCATMGWKRKKNIDLWKLYDKVYEKASSYCSDITFSWVKGHDKSGTFNNEMNNLADKLAVDASHVIL